MKKIILTLSFLLFLISNALMAQTTGIHFGVKAGYSMATQYGINDPTIDYEVDTDARHGFTGGIFLLFPITDAFSVQQEYLFVNKGSRQHVSLTEPPVNTSSEYNINYLELPILFRYTFAHIGDIGIYGSSGFALSVLLSGKWATTGSIDIGGEKVPFAQSGETDGLDMFDYNFIYGLGVMFNVFDQKWFIDYRQTIGWNTLNMPTFEGEEPAPLRNQTYTFTLGMYF
jgi:hypothetical protein